MNHDIGALAEAVNTIKTDIRELKDALLGDSGVATRLALVERDVRELKTAHEKNAEEISEIRFVHRIVKWGAALIAGAVILAKLSGHL